MGDFNALFENETLSSGNVGQDNTATFAEVMSGTETDAPGGSVSGGSDFFTWNQTATDSDSFYLN